MNTRRKKNILLVDDDPFLQSLYRKTLEREGFNVLTANDGVAALKKLPENPDLIVLDLMLPKLDGMKVLQSIRADGQYKGLPVLILSNAYLPDVAHEAMAAGATSGLMKSDCSPKRLVKIIRETLRNVSAPAENKDAKQPAGKNSWIPSLLRNKGGGSEPEPAPRAVPVPDDEFDTSEPEVSPELKNELLKSWPTEIAMIRSNCLKYVKAASGAESEEHLKEIYRRLRLVGARSAMAEWVRVSQLSGALEAMLFEHDFKLDKNSAQSMSQTMFQAVDCLEQLFKNGRPASIESTQKIRTLLVDDDPICNKANEFALRRMDIETVSVTDGSSALALLEKNVFELILLDVEMPGMNGFDVCKSIRKLPRCKDTPIVFVTIKDDFQSRAQSVLCGGNSLIGKPIAPIELIVKTLTFLLRPPGEKAAGDQPSASTAKSPADKNGKQPESAKAPVAPQKVASSGKDLQVAQAAVDEKVKALMEALAAETKRREAAEQQAAEQARIQRKLENDQVEDQKARERLQQMLEEAQKQSQNGEAGQAVKLDGRTRALQAVSDFMEDKSKKLKVKLAEQTIQAQTANDQAAECAKRMSEFEASLAAIRKAKESLVQELQAARTGSRRTELETAIAENQKSQESLVHKIEEAWQEFEAHQMEASMAGAQTIGDEPAADPQADVAEFEKKINELKKALDGECRRTEFAEQEAYNAKQRRTKLEAELTASGTAQEELRAQLAERQKKLDAQIEAHQAELGQLANRAKELELSRTEVEEKVKSLNKTLAEEGKRSETAEKQAADIDERRSALEAELLASKQAQEKLREQLAGQQKQLDAQAQTYNAEVGNLSGRAKELEAGRVAVEEKVQSLAKALADETKRSETVEKQAAEISERRNALEAELAASNQAQTELRNRLTEQQQKLDAQVQSHSAEVGNFSGRTKELEASCGKLEEKIDSLNRALDAEAKRSKQAEQTASEIGERRTVLESELAASGQAQAALRKQLDDQQQKLEAQLQAHQAELTQLGAHSKELETGRQSVEETVKSLTQALAAEKQRSETVEKQAADISQRRSALEAELAASNQAHAQLQGQLAEQQKKLDAQVQSHSAEVGNFSGRTKELEASCAKLEEKIQSLNKTLAAESKRSEKAEQTTSETNNRRTALESELAASNQAQTELRNQLAEQQKKLDAQVQSHSAEVGNFSGRTKELEASCAKLEEKIQSLNKTLAAESKRSEKAEQTTSEISGRRTALESELAASNQSQAELRNQLAEQQKKLDAQVQAHNSEVGNFSGRTKELEASCAKLEEKIQSLNKTLVAETKRSEKAEKTNSEIGERRTALESELAASSQAQAQLRAELAEQQRLLDAQAKTGHVESSKLAARVKELEDSCAVLEKKIESLNKALAAETKKLEKAEQKASEIDQRRAALEAELAASNQTQEQLRTQLAEQQRKFDAQAQAHLAEVSGLASRTKELEGKCTELEDKIKSLNKTLTVEAKKLQKAEEKGGEISERRTALEAELAASSQAQTQLQAQLAEQQQKFDVQVKAHQVEVGSISARANELDGKCASLEKKIDSLSKSLAAETKRSEHAEQLAAEITQRRNALESDLAASNQAQQQLRAQLAEQQKRLDSEVHTHHVEIDNLAGRAKDLEANRMAVEEKVKSLSEALAEETKRSETAERQAADVNQRRSALESELAAANQLQARLQAQIADQTKQLETQAAAHRTEIAGMASRAKELETSRGAVEAKVQALAQSLAAETKRSENAEKQAAELAKRRSALEIELAESNQLQVQLRAQLADQQKQLEVRVQANNAELNKLAAQARNLETSRAIQEEKINALTQALSSEMKRAQAAVEQMAGADKRRIVLEAELAAGAEAQAKLRTQIADHHQQLHIVSAELEGFRQCAQDEAVRHQKMAAQIEQSEKALADLTTQLQSASALASSREDAVNGLNLELQKRRELHERLDASLKGEVAHRQEIEVKVAAVRTQLEEASRQLAQKCAAEQTWIARESELQGVVDGQQDALAKAKAAMATQEADLKDNRIKVEESQILQTVLCAKIQVLSDQGQSAARKIEELESKAARADVSDKHLAGLRYAVLDAARMSAKLQFERFQMERQNLDAMRKLLSSLMQTPLSMAQRSLLAEVHNSMDGLDNSRAVAAQAASCPVEMPNFNATEFCLAVVAESAFASVRMAAKAVGAKVNAALTGSTSTQVAGYAEHLHLLITMLACSPLEISPGVNACDLRLELKPSDGKSADMTMQVVFSTDKNAQELAERLESVTAEAFTPQTNSYNEAEFSFVSGWHLALAMGAQPAIKANGKNEVSLALSISLETASAHAIEKTAAKASAPKLNSNGVAQHARKSKADVNPVDKSYAVTK